MGKILLWQWVIKANCSHLRDGVTWTAGDPGVQEGLRDIIFADGRFVASGENGTILTSQDGAEWKKSASGVSFIIKGVTFGKEGFVAVGGQDSVLTSKDGETWTLRKTGVSAWLKRVTYASGQLYSCGGKRRYINLERRREMGFKTFRFRCNA